MVVISPRRILWIIFRSVDHLISHKLAVLQGANPAHLLVVVHIDHRVLVGGVHRIVVEEFGGEEPPSIDPAFQLWVLLQQHLFVLQVCLEKIAGVLDVLFPRLPIEVQQVHLNHGDVPHPVQQFLVPHHLVNAGAGFGLLPHGVGVYLLKSVAFQDTGDNIRQPLGFLLVSCLPGQNHRAGIALHGICVLGDDDIVQPCRLAGKPAVLAHLSASALLHLGVAQLPPLFAGHNPAVRVALSRLVALQRPDKLLDLLLPHRQGRVLSDFRLRIGLNLNIHIVLLW